MPRNRITRGKIKHWTGQLYRFIPRTAQQWKQLGLFSLFLLVAFTLWYLNKLSQEYTTTLHCAVEVEDPPEGVLFNTNSHLPVELKLRGKGYTLMKLKAAFALAPVPISARRSMMRYMHQRDTLDSVWVLNPQLLQTMMPEILPPTVTLVSLHSDTLRCTFSPMLRQKVPIKPRLNLSFARQYMATDRVTLKPDSVVISGPAAAVRATHQVLTEEVKLDNLSSDLTQWVQLKPIPRIEFSTSETQLSLPIEQFTQWTGSVPVRAEGLPDSLNALLMPKEIMVSCNVPLSRYRDMQATLFQPRVKIPNCITPNTLLVTLDSVPDWVEQVDFMPKYIQYIIKER